MLEAFQLDSLVLGARDWWLAALILASCAVVLALWSYAMSKSLNGTKLLAMLVKIVAIAALAFCLLEPMRKVERPRPGVNVMAIVVDNSRSMQIRPPGGGLSTIDRFRPHLDTGLAWQSRLAQDFDVRRYEFGESLRAVKDYEAIASDSNASAMGNAIFTLQERFDKRPVAGMLLFSDGLATDDIERLGNRDTTFPIYPVVFDGDDNLKDIAVRDVSVTISSFELSPATIDCVVEAEGMEGENIVVRLLDRAGQSVESQSFECDSGQWQERVRFQYRPEEPGVQFVSIRAMLEREEAEDGSAANDSRIEVTTANNTKLATIDRGGGPFRILYVAGRPNWDYKFLRRALEEDVELDLDALVRIARKEPKFSFGDRSVESVNPLIAGFSDDEETDEQYDEPVLLPLGSDNEILEVGFPSGEEDLFAYHAIILDDIEAPFFSPQQMMLMRKFVADRGGGMMFLGGADTMEAGGYLNTPLSDVLPVYLQGAKGAEIKPPEGSRYQLTREGALEPWLRLRASQSDERKRTDRMPSFKVWNSVGAAKPGASIYAELLLPESEERIPGLVGQRFGKGRSLAFTVGDAWRWAMRRAEDDDDDLAQTWRQLARWLTGDVPKRVDVQIESPKQSQDPFQLAVTVRDQLYEPLDNATIKLTVTNPDGTDVSVAATADAKRAGLYRAEYWSSVDGAYECQVDVRCPDGENIDPIVTGWTAQPSATEFHRVSADRRLLEELARDSGGELVEIDDLEKLVGSLPSRRVPVTESRLEPLWHRPWLLLLAVGCLCLEWGIRRWKGLP